MKIINMPSGALGVNTYLAWDEETKKGFIVDPGGYNKALTKKAEENSIDVLYIILTHGHADHIGGVSEQRKDFPHAMVVAHTDEQTMLADPKFNMSTAFGMSISVTADIFVKEGDVLQVGNLKLEFLHTPGHSPGGMCVYIADENALFCGDTLFRQSIGRTDFPGCSFEQLAYSIHSKLFVLPDETDVYPGHMGSTQIGFEKEHNPFV